MIPVNFSNTLHTLASSLLQHRGRFAEFQKNFKPFFGLQCFSSETEEQYTPPVFLFQKEKVLIPKEFSLKQPSSRRLSPDLKS